MQIIEKYFPDIHTKQKEQLAALQDVYAYWNERINLISRKDIENLYERHILHSLSIAKVIDFVPNTKILDVGTGGGFPGIPLAIMFPQIKLHLIDSVGKKIKVVEAVTEALKLTNVSYEQIRAEDVKDQFDFVVSRAVTQLPEFTKWVRGKIRKKSFNKLTNGIIYLKGGDVLEEIIGIGKKYKIFEIEELFEEEFFKSKKIIYLIHR